MRKIISFLVGITLCLVLTRCQRYLNTTSPSNLSDDFVTATPSEAFKVLSWCYANYRQNCIMGVYRWNDPIGSDAETYPEQNSSNNLNAILQTNQLPINIVATGFNSLYTTLAQASKLAGIIAGKSAYQEAVANNQTTDWTQIYGEAVTMWAFCYFNLVKHFGDVPFGYENKPVTNYSLTSRFTIYDSLITSLEKVEPLMYDLGQGGINAERFSRTFCDALIGEIALYSGGYQTIRTDMSGLYGNLKFENNSAEKNGCIYARRTDYLNYYQIAAKYLQAAITNEGSAQLITSDNRSFANNPFQLNFQYFENLSISPESLFQLGNIQGGNIATTSEYGYAFGRPSNGGSRNAAPPKVFAAIRIIPTIYYGDFQKGDKRRDVSVAVTGSSGTGNEQILSFVPGNKDAGGLASNKWDPNRMNPPYTAAQRNSGMDWPVLRMADVILMLAQAEATLGNEAEAVHLTNMIIERAFGNTYHDISGLAGQALKDTILEQRKLELLGEGERRWDMIRSGEFGQDAMAVRQEMAAMITGLSSNGYYRFSNGNEISDYIWTKLIHLDNPLTYDVTDTSNPALYPGWRGQYDYSSLSSVSSQVVGTNHNLAIKGLFHYIDPNSQEADSLEAAGYTKTNWGVDIVNNSTTYMTNILSGLTSANDPPRYYWPIPFETISQSKGKITNGYGLPQQ